MDPALRSAARAPWRLAAALALLAPLAGCIFVQVEGELPDDWLTDVVDASSSSAAGRRTHPGELDLRYWGGVWGLNRRLELHLDCAPEDLEPYYRDVRWALEFEIERDGRILDVEEEGPLACSYAFEKDGERGSASVRILESAGRSDWPYRLELRAFGDT